MNANGMSAADATIAAFTAVGTPPWRCGPTGGVAT